MDSTPTKREPRPPPVYIYDVSNYKAMIDGFFKVVEEETYHTKALPNNTIKVTPHTPDTYRKLIHHAGETRIVHHTYQIKQDRAYQTITYAHTTITYAQATTARPQIQPTNSHNTDVTDQLTTFLNEFKHMFNQLINQRSMILTILTTVINEIAH